MLMTAILIIFKSTNISVVFQTFHSCGFCPCVCLGAARKTMICCKFRHQTTKSLVFHAALDKRVPSCCEICFRHTRTSPSASASASARSRWPPGADGGVLIRTGGGLAFPRLSNVCRLFVKGLSLSGDLLVEIKFVRWRSIRCTLGRVLSHMLEGNT